MTRLAGSMPNRIQLWPSISAFQESVNLDLKHPCFAARNDLPSAPAMPCALLGIHMANPVHVARDIFLSLPVTHALDVVGTIVFENSDRHQTLWPSG